MTAPKANGVVARESLQMASRGEFACDRARDKSAMAIRAETACDRAKSCSDLPSDGPRAEHVAIPDDRRRASSPSWSRATTTAPAVVMTTTLPPNDVRDAQGVSDNGERQVKAEERRGTGGEFSNAGLVSSTLSIGKDLKSILSNKDCELERLRLMHQNALSARDRQIRSLQADNDSLTSQLSDRMRQVHVVQEASQLKDQHIDLLKNIVKDLQDKITSPKHTSRAQRDTSLDDLKAQIRRKDEQLATAESKIADLKKQLEFILSPKEPTEPLPAACKQDDKILSTLAKEVDVANGADLPPFPCPQQQQMFADRHASTRGSQNERDQMATTSDASSQTNLDSVQEAMSEVVAELERTRNLLATKEGELKRTVDLVNTLNKELKWQRHLCSKQEKLIDGLKSSMRSKNAQLLDNGIQCLQAAISERDTSIALLEMQGKASLKNRSSIDGLKQERNKLMRELKEKMHQKMDLLQGTAVDDEVEDCTFTEVSSQDRSLEQICKEIRVLEQSKSQLRGYIDQLLALVLERNPGLLEGLPRIQQNLGMSPDLLRVASLPELLLERREDEEDMNALQSYAGLLLQKMADYSPDLLKCVDQLCLSS